MRRGRMIIVYGLLPPSSPILRIDENLGRKPKPVAEWGGLGRFTITAGPKKDERRGGRERDNLCPFLFRFLPPLSYFSLLPSLL